MEDGNDNSTTTTAMATKTKTPEELKSEMEADRAFVAEVEKEIASIKAKLRILGPNPALVDVSELNSLEIVVLKVSDLPDTAKPNFSLQLSAPIEELTITKLYDPQDAEAEGSSVVFRDVERSVATLTISAKDADIPLGVSTTHDVAKFGEKFDVMKPEPTYVTELNVRFFPEKPKADSPTEAETETSTEKGEGDDDKKEEEEERDVSKDEGDSDNAKKEETPTSATSSSPDADPICTATIRVTFTPAAKDEREELYELLNKAMERKSKGIDQLRKSAMMAARAGALNTPSSSSSTTGGSRAAVQAGFLNKNAAGGGGKGVNAAGANDGAVARLRDLYERYLGPQSLIRVIIPIAKNFVIFFGAVILFHFKGQELALPPPV